MGSLLTAVKECFTGISTLIGVLAHLNQQYKALMARITAAPGLPNPTPTLSYWLQDPPYPHLDQKPRHVPDEVDVVIVGSGITAASVARTLLLLHPSLTVVVLEARQICSGATGRNGGHIKVAPYGELDRFTEMLGRERAIEMIKFQLRHLDCLLGMCEREGWDIAECRAVDTVDLYLESFGNAKRKVHELREWIPEVRATLWEAEEARTEFGVNDRIEGAVSYRAGALFPYRLVTSVWDTLLKKFPHRVTLVPETPVLSITTSSTSYLVKTKSKIIRSQHVVHATNAFAAELVPNLRGRLTGALAHMTAQRPGPGFSDHDGRQSWSVFYDKGFEYVTQRPRRTDGTPGDVMLGGGWTRSKEEGLDMLGEYDDSKTDTFTLAYLFGIFGSVFTKWAGGDAPPVAWTGTIGITGDRLPFVGLLNPEIAGRKLPSKANGKPEKLHDVDGGSGMAPAGEWISAGFNGEGMVFAWLCGVALGMMMLGKEHAGATIPGIPSEKLGEWFPRELRISKERLRRAALKNLVEGVM